MTRFPVFSKALELTGLGLFAVGLSVLLGYAAGLMFGGVALVFLGSTTDDAAVGAAIRRGASLAAYAYRRQIAREGGTEPPARPGTSVGFVPCACGGDEECPVCEGYGYVPDPAFVENPRSPHPKLRIDPDTQEFWDRLADSRRERSKLRDRTPALSRR
jgi:hypothetical protein